MIERAIAISAACRRAARAEMRLREIVDDRQSDLCLFYAQSLLQKLLQPSQWECYLGAGCFLGAAGSRQLKGFALNRFQGRDVELASLVRTRPARQGVS